jgi:hypothetical protein
VGVWMSDLIDDLMCNVGLDNDKGTMKLLLLRDRVGGRVRGR